jgi:hypothetical protein
MQINADTKIAALLKQHPAALEAIVSIHPVFKKLRNPVLRKMMAGRTSIDMACRIAGCTPPDLYKVLQPLGFEVKNAGEIKPLTMLTQDIILPGWITAASNIIAVDVRPLLTSGKDPLQLIQQQVKFLQPNEVLQIINTFEPTPLIMMLAKKGFTSYVNRIDDNLVATYFINEKVPNVREILPAQKKDYEWDDTLQRFDNNLVHLDVRHLNMPLPMTTILEALETMPDCKALYVHHKRIPVFLLTELKDLKFDYCIKEVSGNEVFLLIFKPLL